MKLSISNIAWTDNYDEQMYAYLRERGYDGLEIAPTRIFPKHPYEHLDEARNFAAGLRKQYGLAVSSMQSIWYGRVESIFGSAGDRRALVDYTKQAVDFAAALSCGNLVFGCPKNRNIPGGCDNYIKIAAEFFAEIADYAEHRGTVIALEPNPPYYGTNFINKTAEAFDFVKAAGNPGLKVNADLGTLIYNGESVNLLKANISLINHIHISEPNLVQLERRDIHAELRNLDYDRYVSIEMKIQENIEAVKHAVEYVAAIFGG
jgi:sugar phosphate isomerase/epimerase